MTPYQYVHNNPINIIDPTGMYGERWEGGGHGDRKGDSFISKAWNTVKSWFGGGKPNTTTIIGPIEEIEEGANSSAGSSTSFSDVSTAGQLGGGLALGLLKDGASNRMDKSFYNFGTSSFSNSFANAEMDFHTLNSVQSMSQMKTLSSTMSFISKGLDYTGYIDGFSKIYNEEYSSGVHSAVNNFIGTKIGSSFGWGYGLLYSASYTGWEYTLTRSQTYNKIMFGERSPQYNSRRHHWQKSKLLGK